MKRLVIIAGLVLLALAAFIASLYIFSEPMQDGKPVSYWISQMGTMNSSGKWIGETALNKMKPEKVVPYLVQTIGKKKQPETKLHRIYRHYYNQIPDLARRHLADPALSPQTDLIQMRAAYYLSNLGEKKNLSAIAAIPKLAPFLNDTNAATRFYSAIALSGFGKEASPAMPIIVNLLQTRPENVNDPMFTLLAQHAPEAKTAIPPLQKNLRNSSGFIRIECAKTLWKLDQTQVDLIRPVAMEASTNNDEGVRIESASLLWRMDKDPKPVVPILIGLLNDDSRAFDYRAIHLLKSIGPQASNAIPALSDWLKRNRATKARSAPFVVETADEAMKAMGGSPGIKSK